MKTILIVEDEVSIAEVLGAWLEEEGYQVAIARQGLAALGYLATVTPDLILCDVMMPRMDGRGLCRALQENPAYRSIPLVMMSASDDAVTGLPCPYEAFLLKPFRLDALQRLVRQLIGPPP